MTYSPDEPRDDHGRWTDAALGGHIERALAESPGRLTHGHTTTNAFFVTTNGRIIQHNQLRGREPNSVSVHSHLPDGGAVDLSKIHDTFSGGDIQAYVKQAKFYGTSSFAVMTSPNTMDVLAIRPDTDPAFFKLGAKRIDDQVGGPYEVRSAWWEANKGRSDISHLATPSSEFFRERMRDFAKKYRLDYRENVPFRASPKVTRSRVKKL